MVHYDKQEILKEYTLAISKLDISIINVMIDKRKIKRNDYKVLENALTYNIQRIENDSAGKWNYLIITDKGRLSPMRKTARRIRAYNPIHSKYSQQIKNQPIHSLIEDILEKIRLNLILYKFVILYHISHICIKNAV